MTAAAAQTGTQVNQSILNAFAQLVADKTPYVWGGVTQLGADCSGAVLWAANKAGISLGGARTAVQQAGLGAAVPLAGADKLANAVPGDPLFFDEGGGTIDHEALYAGGGMDYEESHTGTNARLIPVDTAHLVAIRQWVAADGSLGAGLSGTPVAVAGTNASTPTTATLTGISLNPITDLKGLASSSVTKIAMEVLFVAGGAGLVIVGAYKTASPS